MATTAKKKSQAKKKPALKQSKKVNPWLVAAGAIVVAIIGVIVVRSSFAGSWPNASGQCGGVTTRIDRYTNPPVLKQGSQGYCVKLLQQGLKATGFMSSSAVTDGVFGPKTGDSVFLLETYYKFGVKDRVASKCTWLAMQGAAYYGKTNTLKVANYVKSQGANCF